MTFNFLNGGFSAKNKILFTKNLAVMLRAGLGINEALEIAANQVRGGIRSVLAEINKRIAGGNKLADSLALYPRYFSAYYVHTTRAGETSGNLENNLERLAERLEKEDDFREKVRCAMFYPIIVLVLSLVIALTISFFVLPKILPIFTGLKVKLPAATVMLIGFSSFMLKYNWQVITVLAALIVLIVAFLRAPYFRPWSHYLYLRIPLLSGFSRYKNTAIIFATLGTLIKSGLGIDEALAIAADTIDNYYYRRAVKRIKADVSAGKKIVDSLRAQKNYFTEMSIGLVGVGERSGNLEEQLMAAGAISEKEIERAIKLFATMLEPALLIFIGLVVGGLALAIIMPIYEITGNIYK